MLSRASRRLLSEAQWPSFLPPSFLVPAQTRAWLTTVSHTLDAGSVPEPLLAKGQRTAAKGEIAQRPETAESDAFGSLSQSLAAAKSAAPISVPQRAGAPSSPKSHAQPLALSENLRSMLPLLLAQHSHYATIHIHGKLYLVTQGDTIRLPFLMPDVRPGDTLRLDCATVIGSRDFTLKAGPSAPTNTHRDGAPINNSASNVSMTEGQRQRLEQKRRVKLGYLDDRLFVCRAVVTGVETEPMRVMEKKKQRNRHTRHVLSKHRYTCLRISELRLKGLGELEEQGASATAAGVTESGAVVETTTPETV